MSDYTTDAILWGLLTLAVGLVWLGCHNTRKRRKPVSPERK